MGTGIVLCGLNGTGKSTLGKALAEKLKFYFMDSEALYFPKTDPCYRYTSSRTRGEAEKLLFSEIHAHENFTVLPNILLAICFDTAQTRMFL